MTSREKRPDNISKNIRGAWWNCECDCGNAVTVRGNALESGNTLSCGCLNSKAELKIRELLNKKQIKYYTQFWFDDLRSPITNWVLKFDFAIFSNEMLVALLEYDGEQHYSGTRFSKNEEVNIEKFKRAVMYDKLKNEYCHKNNIKLVRIPYWEFNNIETILNNLLKEVI